MKLYRKSELGFALLWIGIYCIGMSAADELSRAVGLEHSVSAVFSILTAGFLLYWIGKSGLQKYYGLCRPCAPAKRFLFYLPLILLTAGNLWGGVFLRFGPAETVCFTAKMLCVGILEEIIFRGFLFRALCRTGVRRAVVISSITFGIGHILNLINGSGMGIGENLLQIVMAILFGLLFVTLFLRGGSLIPCMLSHGLYNALSAFSRDVPEKTELLLLAALSLLLAAYTLVLCRTLPAGGRAKP